MASFILPYRWRQQPQYAVDINWNHPLSHDLAIALNFGDPRCFMGQVPLNLATNGRFGLTGTTAAEKGTGALGQWFGKGNANDNYLTVDQTQPATESTLFVVLANNNGAGSLRTVFSSQGGTTNDWLGVNSTSVPIVATGSTVRCTGVTVAANQAIGYRFKNQNYQIFQNGVVTGTGSANGGNGATTHLLGLVAGNTKSSRVYCLYIWQRALSEAEHSELAKAPYQFFKPIQRRLYVFPTTAPLAVAIDVAGSVTIAGQSATFNLGVAVPTAGAVTIAGQSATVGLGAGLDAGQVTVAGQSATVDLGVDLATAGSVTIGGEDAAFILSGNLFATIATPGSITIQGQDVDVALEGDVNLAIDVAGSITIAGQDCAFTLTSEEAGGAAKGGKRKRRRLRPDELEPFAVEINFLQPWQTCDATVEVTGELALGFGQEGGLLNATTESVTEVEIDARQEVAELIASFYAAPLRLASARAMPKPETARVRVAIAQPAHELTATVEIA